MEIRKSGPALAAVALVLAAQLTACKPRREESPAAAAAAPPEAPAAGDALEEEPGEAAAGEEPDSREEEPLPEEPSGYLQDMDLFIDAYNAAAEEAGASQIDRDKLRPVSWQNSGEVEGSFNGDTILAAGSIIFEPGGRVWLVGNVSVSLEEMTPDYVAAAMAAEDLSLKKAREIVGELMDHIDFEDPEGGNASWDLERNGLTYRMSATKTPYTSFVSFSIQTEEFTRLLMES